MPQIQFRFDFADYIHAQKLHRHGWQGLDLLLPISGAIALAGGLAMVRDRRFHSIAFIEFAACLFLLSYPLLVRLHWRYCYRRTRSNNGELNFEFTDEVIRTRTSVSRGEVEWSGIRSFAEDKDIFLLYIAPAKSFPIPKRACTAEEIDELRALFQRRVEPH